MAFPLPLLLGGAALALILSKQKNAAASTGSGYTPVTVPPKPGASSSVTSYSANVPKPTAKPGVSAKPKTPVTSTKPGKPTPRGAQTSSVVPAPLPPTHPAVVDRKRPEDAGATPDDIVDYARQTFNPNQTLAQPTSKGQIAVDTARSLTGKTAGKEDKKQVALFQKSEGLKADGLYGPSTAMKMVAYDLVPPKPLYWSKSNGTADKATWKKQMLARAAKDPSRAAEWNSAAKV